MVGRAFKATTYTSTLYRHLHPTRHTGTPRVPSTLGMTDQ
jgi:hypothetical protein